MDCEQGKKQINGYIKNGEIKVLRGFLTSVRGEEWFDNNLRLLFCLTGVHDLELRYGYAGLFSRYEDMSDVLSDHLALRSMVRKLEWWEEDTAEELRQMMTEKSISRIETSWAIEVCCVDREAVRRRIRDDGQS